MRLDGETLAAYDYGRFDPDAGLAADRLSSAVPVPQGASPVFGTMESIVYARPRPMDFGPVAYVPELRAFVADHRHLVPDAVLASSLDRRLLPWRGGGVAARPLGIDKPSSSLFVPPEYRAVNCHVCSATLGSVSVAVATTLVVAGAPVRFVLGAGGDCAEDHGGPQGPGLGAPALPAWRHSVSFGDGSTAAATGSPAEVGHTYASGGTYKVRNRVSCPCDSVLSIGERTVDVQVASCTAPAFEQRQLALVPGTRLVNHVGEESAFGKTSFVGIPAAQCVKLCRNGTETWRLEGDVNTTLAIEVYLRIKAAHCREAPRASARIAPSEAHERRHASGYLRTANNYKLTGTASNGKEFRSRSECLTARDAYVAAYQSDEQRQYQRQEAHCDHIHRRYGVVCREIEGRRKSVRIAYG